MAAGCPARLRGRREEDQRFATDCGGDDARPARMRRIGRRLRRWGGAVAQLIDGELVALVLTIDAGALLWLLWLVGRRFGWW